MATTTAVDGYCKNLKNRSHPVRRAWAPAVPSRTPDNVSSDFSTPNFECSPGSSDQQTDYDQESESDTEYSAHEDADVTAGQSGPNSALDSETEEIYNNIARFKAEGPAKPNHTVYTIKLWRRESEFWQRQAITCRIESCRC